jgi:hypothetical protein
MKSTYWFCLALVLGLAATSAFAMGNGPPNPCGNHGNNCNQGGGNNTNTVTNRNVYSPNNTNKNYNTNINSNKQGQIQGQIQGQKQGQGQDQQQQANNEGNHQSTTFNEAKQDKNTPSMGVANVYPTANCRTAMSASVAVAGFGFGGGGTPMDENCAYLEASRHAARILGNRVDAHALFCMSEYGGKAPSCLKAKTAATGTETIHVSSADDSPFPQ